MILTAVNVPLGAGVPRDAVRIEILDTGHGISPDHLPHVFEPYFTTKQGNRAAGLGLTQVRRFAEQFGVEVCIESEPGKGTRVALMLPRAHPDISAARFWIQGETTPQLAGTVELWLPQMRG